MTDRNSESRKRPLVEEVFKKAEYKQNSKRRSDLPETRPDSRNPEKAGAAKKRLTPEELNRIDVLVLDLVHGSKEAKDNALAKLVDIHYQQFIRTAVRVAHEWGIMDPVIEAQEAVMTAVVAAYEERMETFQLKKVKGHGIFFKWLCTIIFEMLRGTRDQQVFTVLNELGLERIIRVLGNGPVSPKRRRIGIKEFEKVVQLLDSSEEIRLLEAKFMRSRRGISWEDILQALGWREGRLGSKTSAPRTATQTPRR